MEANNDLVQATREEETEILRVLAALTDAVRAALPELDDLVAGIGGLDLIFARGALAERMERGRARDRRRARRRPAAARSTPCSSPRTGPADGGRPVIPMDIEITAERPLLVITGPNAGGKTVALKTLGLLVLMAQSGCHVPARDGARLPVLLAVLRDRGRRAERGGEPLDVLRLRQAAPRGARARGRPLARAARRAGRGHRSRRRRRAGPGGAGGPGRARRGGRGLHPPRAAQGLRLDASEGPQRLGGVRSRAARPHLPAHLRSPGPELRARPSAPASACPPR